MLTGILVYKQEDAERNRDFIDWLITEAKNLGMRLELHNRENLFVGIDNNQAFLSDRENNRIICHFALIRCIDSIFTRQLELMQIPTFNSALVSELCNDKAKTYQFAHMLGIRIANSVFLATNQQAPYPFPYVQKDRSGRGGQEVFLVEKAADVRLCANQLAQQLVTPGKDVRVFVIGKEIIGAVMRTSTTNFKANYSLGGEIALHSLSDSEKAIVERITQTLDFGFVGIDFVYDEQGKPLLNEIEDVVGCRSLCQLTEINIARLYLQYVKDRLILK